MSWQTFSVLVLPAKYPSLVLEVSVPTEVAKLQCKAQHFKTVLQAVLMAPGTWLLVSVCPHSLVLVQVVKPLKHRVSSITQREQNIKNG